MANKAILSPWRKLAFVLTIFGFLSLSIVPWTADKIEKKAMLRIRKVENATGKIPPVVLPPHSLFSNMSVFKCKSF